MELYPHKSEGGPIQPVALPNYNVAIHYTNTLEYRRVTYLEPIPPFQFLNIGALAANTASNRMPAPLLQMPNDEFLQFRWWPLDHVQVRLYVPASNGRWNVLAGQGVLDDNIVYNDPCLHLTEFFVWQSNSPAFEAINISAVGIPVCRLKGFGFRYTTRKLEAATKDILKLVAEKGEDYRPMAELQVLSAVTHVWCSGRSA